MNKEKNKKKTAILDKKIQCSLHVLRMTKMTKHKQHL